LREGSLARVPLTRHMERSVERAVEQACKKIRIDICGRERSEQ
jgi:hypothetical protein